MPLGVGRGQNVGLKDFCHILTWLSPGASVFHKYTSSLFCFRGFFWGGGGYFFNLISFVSCH